MNSLNISEERIYRSLMFVPRMENKEYLMLLSFVSVFLNPFPFGSGITSSDALSLCIPVVTLPSEISVLHFAMAQIVTMFPDKLDSFVASNISTYANLAVSFATASIESKSETRNLICNRKLLLFGPDSLLQSVNEWRVLLLRLAQNIFN